MPPANLHTLDDDTIYGILILCPDLSSLRSLILTHPAICRTFYSHRRLVLRAVYGKRSRKIAAVLRFVLSIKTCNEIDRVAFLEAFQPDIERLVPGKAATKAAEALVDYYHKANLKDDALTFGKRTMERIFDTCECLHPAGHDFARAFVRTYVAANLPEEALKLRQRVLVHLDPRRTLAHSHWVKQLVITYRTSGDSELVLQQQLDTWKLYKTWLGPDSDFTLDWARTTVSEYQSRGDEQQAIQFQQTVRSTLNPAALPYVAWSRRLIKMHKRANQDAEALKVMEEVWSHLRPISPGYRAWAADLSEQYEACGRPEDAIAVCEAAWTVITGVLDQNRQFPESWRYHARGAGLMLAKAYRRHQRVNDACVVEAKCNEFKI